MFLRTLSNTVFRRPLSSQIDGFRAILPDSCVVTDDFTLKQHNVDWLHSHTGQSELLLLPKTTEHVQQIVKYCNTHSLKLNVQGGNTGLVGGSVPIGKELIINMKNMNKLISVDESMRTVTCEAGAILQSVNDNLQKYSLMMPYDLGAKGSCHVGGNLATNAGGIRFLRYGSLHGSCLGMEVVTGNGDVIDMMKGLKKDNTGFHLHKLFVGSEGTLGIITKAVIQCAVLPKSQNLVFLVVDSYQRILDIYQHACNSMGEILSAFEMLDEGSMKCVEKQLNLRRPVSNGPFYIVIETSGSNEEHDSEKVNSFLEMMINDSLVLDGVLAQDRQQFHDMWHVRESIALAALSVGYCYKYDVSLPLEHYYELVLATRERLADHDAIAIGYGHIGDANLHLNIACSQFSEQLLDLIEPWVFEWVADHNGSISAEHGIGQHKTTHLHLSKSPEAIDYMKRLKSVFDSNHILNPGKTLPN